MRRPACCQSAMSAPRAPVLDLRTRGDITSTRRRLRRSGLEVPGVGDGEPGGDVAREAAGIGLRAELELSGDDRQDVCRDPGVERELAGGGWHDLIGEESGDRIQELAG